MRLIRNNEIEWLHEYRFRLPFSSLYFTNFRFFLFLSSLHFNFQIERTFLVHHVFNCNLLISSGSSALWITDIASQWMTTIFQYTALNGIAWESHVCRLSTSMQGTCASALGTTVLSKSSEQKKINVPSDPDEVYGHRIEKHPVITWPKTTSSENQSKQSVDWS